MFRPPDIFLSSYSGIPAAPVFGGTWEADTELSLYYTLPDIQCPTEMALVSCILKSFWSLVVKCKLSHFFHIQPCYHLPLGLIPSSALAGCRPWRLCHTPGSPCPVAHPHICAAAHPAPLLHANYCHSQAGTGSGARPGPMRSQENLMPTSFWVAVSNTETQRPLEMSMSSYFSSYLYPAGQRQAISLFFL